ncbi:hypothetical protein CEUSTIGMA_g3300.t1 [Chlamydomonas eustigma]|uniref:Uncharacterized protein n=1 Tax=Chlamydomonas eustigma TaxID=1157962 RepID=A0A250WYD6_9CHLO|nr:hypothetical protein CEUSTIGMA_g3300.t1 [Chlamydomonas eustigma]|eukprot:GAX75857.1 hypothetical protein CEUSTIGMA_g3300.t1 [Chlamydomonas eustigma]
MQSRAPSSSRRCGEVKTKSIQSSRCRAVCDKKSLHSRHMYQLYPDHVEEVSTSSSCSSLADFGTRFIVEQIHFQIRGTALKNASEYLWLPTAYLANAIEEKPQRTKEERKRNEYFANVGDAIRTLREDIPSLFNRDLNYDIYRDDIVFRDTRNSLHGKRDYKILFWSLRFHGRIFFSKLSVDVKRVWQPEESVIKMRWTVIGIPRVPWDAEGIFDGISTYKLDSEGKIYEHSVDNLILRDPPLFSNPALLAGLNLQPSHTAPQLGTWFVDPPVSEHNLAMGS